MKELKWIEDYITYLMRECGLSVSLHPMEEERLISSGRLMLFNLHANSYCTHVKANKQGHGRCLLQQARVFEKIKSEGEPFCGICPAGVVEYVYPIKNETRVIGFLSVSGYSSPEGRGRIAGFAVRYGYSRGTLERIYEGLPTVAASRERTDALIMPLCAMLELAYRKAPTVGEGTLMERILGYVQKNYDRDLKSEEICHRFGCSRSTFSHLFRTETGKSFREYLTSIRIENAKRLLVNSDLSVGEIAFSLGFNDSNYFTNVFKRQVGITPLAYRRERR